MPNRRQTGYMPTRHNRIDTSRNIERSEQAQEKLEHERGKTPEDDRQDLTGAGDFGRPYEQWSKGDLYNRARQLDVRGRGAMTKQKLIDTLRQRERGRR